MSNVKCQMCGGCGGCGGVDSVGVWTVWTVWGCTLPEQCSMSTGACPWAQSCLCLWQSPPYSICSTRSFPCSALAPCPPGSIVFLEEGIPANVQFIQNKLQNHLVTLKWDKFINIADSLMHLNTYSIWKAFFTITLVSTSSDASAGVISLIALARSFLSKEPTSSSGHLALWHTPLAKEEQ